MGGVIGSAVTLLSHVLIVVCLQVLGSGQHSCVFGVHRLSDNVALALKVEHWGQPGKHMRLLKLEAECIEEVSRLRKKVFESESAAASSVAAAAANIDGERTEEFTRVVNWCQFFNSVKHPDDEHFVVDAMVMPRYERSLSEWITELDLAGSLTPRSSSFAQLLPSHFASMPPTALLVRVARELLMACRDLHASGFVHRDISPMNFIMRRINPTTTTQSTANDMHDVDEVIEANSVEPDASITLDQVLDDHQLVLLDYGCGDVWSRISAVASRAPPKKKAKASVVASDRLQNGTADYASLLAHTGAVQSYRDDVEGVGSEEAGRRVSARRQHERAIASTLEHAL